MRLAVIGIPPAAERPWAMDEGISDGLSGRNGPMERPHPTVRRPDCAGRTVPSGCLGFPRRWDALPGALEAQQPASLLLLLVVAQAPPGRHR